MLQIWYKYTDDIYFQVSMDLVMKIAKQNCHKAISIIQTAVKQIAQDDWTNDIKQAQVIRICVV